MDWVAANPIMPGIEDLGLFIDAPLDYVIGAISGLNDGGAMVYNAAIYFPVDDWADAHVDTSIQENGGYYALANLSAHIGVLAAGAAAGTWTFRIAMAARQAAARAALDASLREFDIMMQIFHDFLLENALITNQQSRIIFSSGNYLSKFAIIIGGLQQLASQGNTLAQTMLQTLQMQMGQVQQLANQAGVFLTD
jgi:hypothetical protein